MDSFAEQLVVKDDNGSGKRMKIFVLCMAVVLGVITGILSVMYLPVGLLISCGIIYLGYVLSGQFEVEYEYTVTNGELDIDKIIAKSRRKNLLNADVKTFESFSKYEEAQEEQDGITVVIAVGECDYEAYCADFVHPEHGRMRLIFTPDENILEAVKPFLPRNIRR